MGIMFINIYEIAPEGVRFDEPVTVPPSEVATAEGIEVREARLCGSAAPGKRGVDFSARLEARVALECSRCLQQFEIAVSTEFFLTLVPDGTEFGVGEVQVRAEDTSLFYAREGRVALGEVAAEQIYLNLPLKPICAEGCRGLCPTCGVNRNRIQCGCRTEEIDPRLAPLLEFKKRTGGA
jgi:uncharacterized protein